MAGDLTVPDFPQKLVDATIQQLGSIDIIVNNAGYTWDNVIQKMLQSGEVRCEWRQKPIENPQSEKQRIPGNEDLLLW